MKKLDLPPGVLQPREAVLKMAAYSPPSAGRADKLRLDFNENTVGASPKVIECLRERLTPESLSIYPEYGQAKQELAGFFRVDADDFILTNGTDEAIQVLVNTYVDDGDEVLVLSPSYAMYRFYAELAGASVRDIPYRAQKLAFPLEELLDAITPDTRAVLIANPNNPTGTGTTRAGLERILEQAENAAVLIDEAYYEFCGVTALGLLQDYPNLFVSRTFSKVYGMAAMRLGCLFSQNGNIDFLHKAQSPYSVNTVATIAARAAIEDTAYIQKYVTEVLAARELLYVGLEQLGISYYESKANFVLFQAGARAIPLRDELRRRGVLVRDRSYEIAGCVRVTVGTREQIRRFLSELGGDLVMDRPEVLVFDMDGVLVEVSESYRETIVQTVKIFTGKTISREFIQEYKNRGGYNNDWILSQKICRDLGVEAAYESIVETFMDLFINQGLINRERWIPQDGLLDRLAERYELAIFTGRSTMEAEITLNRQGLRERFLLVTSSDVEREKPAPDGLLKIAALRPGKPLLYVGDTVDDARAARAANVPFIGIAAPNSPRRPELVAALEGEGAMRILGTVNEIG